MEKILYFGGRLQGLEEQAAVMVVPGACRKSLNCGGKLQGSEKQVLVKQMAQAYGKDP